MSVTHIPESVKFRLWGKAAGRCQYSGCNKPLWLDSLTSAEFNIAYIAHIIADKPDGPRGDKQLSEKLADDISNLMLMCDEHHRLIDKIDVPGHPVAKLVQMKEEHENRVEILGAIKSDKQSQILLYGANIGDHTAPLTYENVALAMVPHAFPANRHPIALGLKNNIATDKSQAYWQMELLQLEEAFKHQVRPRITTGEIKHLSVFALAPQPLLIRLGVLLGDISDVTVYQLHREPKGWKWEDQPTAFQFRINEPANKTGPAALIFSLSGSIKHDHITAVLGQGVSIWEVTIPNPSNDFLRSQAQVVAFRHILRDLLNQIKLVHGQTDPLHIFPAMPVALAVEFGRIRMPKAEMPLIIYDLIDAHTGFVKTVEIKRED